MQVYHEQLPNARELTLVYVVSEKLATPADFVEAERDLAAYFFRELFFRNFISGRWVVNIYKDGSRVSSIATHRSTDKTQWVRQFLTLSNDVQQAATHGGYIRDGVQSGADDYIDGTFGDAGSDQEFVFVGKFITDYAY